MNSVYSNLVLLTRKIIASFFFYRSSIQTTDIRPKDILVASIYSLDDKLCSFCNSVYFIPEIRLKKYHHQGITPDILAIHTGYICLACKQPVDLSTIKGNNTYKLFTIFPPIRSLLSLLERWRATEVQAKRGGLNDL